MADDEEEEIRGRAPEDVPALRRLLLEWRIPLGPGRRRSERRPSGSNLSVQPSVQRLRTDRTLLADSRRQYLISRAETLLSQAPGGERQEGVFKAISWLKSSGSVRRAVEYIVLGGKTEETEQEPAMAWHEIRPNLALPLRTAESIARALDQWELLGDAENLSAKARAVDAVARRSMPVRERLHYRQALHGVFSAALRQPHEREKFVEAARDALRGAFVARGHRVIWAIHEDRRRIHIHMVVKTQQDSGCLRPGARPGRLQFGWRTADQIRHLFVERMRARGLDLTARSREDRRHLRDRIAQGEESLRTNRPLTRRTDASDRVNDLAKYAPAWASVYLASYERRRAERVAQRVHGAQ